MFPTMDDAAYIYARACRAWYGRQARDVVRGKLAQVKATGDKDGVAIWEKVEREVTDITGGESAQNSRPERPSR